MRPHLPITTKSKHIFLLGALFTAIAIILAILIITGTHIFQRTSALKYVTSSGSDESSALESKLGTMLGSNPAPLPSPTIMLSPPPGRYVIPQQTHVYQTFNNCGPASLSMLLSYRGTHISQKELGDILRPRQHPQGIDDDKSVTIPELAQEAKNRGLAAYHRPGATLDLVKTLIASDFPLLIRTWLKEGEDIGHYRILRGYDDATQELIQDDSLQGENLRYSYARLLSLWQPFQYEFLVIATPGEVATIEAILGEHADETKAWRLYEQRAIAESRQEPNNVYPLFNQSIAAHYLGDYPQAVLLYEQAASRLPARMLWYQIQPIDAYLQVGNYSQVFAMTERILSGPNKAFSELHVLRGQAHERLGNTEAARREYELAVLYNQNLRLAQEALDSL